LCATMRSTLIANPHAGRKGGLATNGATIDDTDVNCDSARALGMSAVHYRDNNQAIGEIREALERLDLPPPADEARMPKVLETVRACGRLLFGYEAAKEAADQGEVKRIEKKLWRCLDVQGRSLGGTSRGEKRDGGEIDENAKKKRRLEREMLEKEGEVYGPALEKAKQEAEGNGEEG